jgi:hypothetical protein
MNELKRMWKEVVVASFKVLAHFPGETAKATKNLRENSRSLGLYLSPGPPEHEVVNTLCVGFISLKLT